MITKQRYVRDMDESEQTQFKTLQEVEDMFGKDNCIRLSDNSIAVIKPNAMEIFTFRENGSLEVSPLEYDL